MIVDSIYFKGHTCFRNEWSGFDTIKPINVIIGRNNSGKSHLLDLVEVMCSGRFDESGWQFRCRGVLNQTSLQRTFPPDTEYLGGPLPGNRWQQYGQRLVNVEMTWETDDKGRCHEVCLPAAELLVPLHLLQAEYSARAPLSDELDRLARRFKVSTLVILRRIHDAGFLTRQAFRSAYLAELDRLGGLSGGEGGDFYPTLGARVSQRFARAIVTSTLEVQTSFSESFRLLGFRKMETFSKLANNLGLGS